MSSTQRIGAAALAVVALGLTATGVVLAATDPHPNPGGGTVDALALNGYPPSTAELAVTIDAGAQSLTGTLNIDFATNAAEATVNVPLGVATVPTQLILTKHHLYIGASSLAGVVGRSWLAATVHTPSLYDWSLEMTHPDISMISGYQHRSVTTSGAATTYHFVYPATTLRVPGLLQRLIPSSGALDVAISVGSQREFTGATIAAASATTSTSITVTVLSYNRPLTIAGPPRGEVRALTPGLARRVLRGLSGLGALLSPGSLGGGSATLG